MMTWTCKFKGHYLPGYAVVSADNVDLAIILLQKELGYHGLTVEIKREDLIPMVTKTRKVRVLFNGDY